MLLVEEIVMSVCLTQAVEKGPLGNFFFFCDIFSLVSKSTEAWQRLVGSQALSDYSSA